jgi:SET domain-containing protein
MVFPAAAFFAARDIAKGEELTFNYDPQKNRGNKVHVCG